MRPGVLLFLLLAAAPLAADESLNPPAPFAPSAAAPSPGQAILTLAAARRAQELGFPSVAADLYGKLLAAGAGDRAELTLARATSLIDDGRSGEAEQALDGLAAPRGSAWHLRMALVATQQAKPDEIRRHLAMVREGELGPADRPWYVLLQGQLAAAAGNAARAGDLYRQAEQAAPNDLARARFLLADEESSLRRGRVTNDDLTQAKNDANQFRGTATGYDFARTYAVMLNARGRPAEAMAVLEGELRTLPPEERSRADDFRLLLGLIGGAADGPGRSALVQLLETGGDADHQRMALQMLAGASHEGSARASFRAELDRLVAAPGPSPILEDLLLFRAEFALDDRDYNRAEDDANALLDKFPASPLRVHAWGVLVGSAWQQDRFRTAADRARQARDVPGVPAETRALLGVLVAEAYFRAGEQSRTPEDFGEAAAAYANALREPSATVAPGNLMFQQVESEIEAGDLPAAAQVLDRLARDPAFDPVDRWEAEWNLARALQVAGLADEAYQRVDRLLAPSAPGPALPAELRARMAWLQAQLSFDAREYDQTLRYVGAIGDLLDDLPPDLKSSIASTDLLLEAQADFALSREGEADLILKKLRADFPQTDSAVYSYIIAAEHYAQQNRVIDAERLLIQLVDGFPRSSYAPYALYKAALLSESLGQRVNFEEANRYIETLVKQYPDSYLLFYARLEQGELMEKLNQYAQAEQDYDDLQHHFAQHPDVVLAQLALAECYNAQSAGDPAHAEQAMDLFGHLCERVDAPADVRVEAGFNLGELLVRHRRLAEAQTVWWRDVVTEFLLSPKHPERAAQLGAKGRYWMARTLIELGNLEAQQGRLEEAKQAWLLVLRKGLPFAASARDLLAPFGLPGPGS